MLAPLGMLLDRKVSRTSLDRKGQDDKYYFRQRKGQEQQDQKYWFSGKGRVGNNKIKSIGFRQRKIEIKIKSIGLRKRKGR